MANNNSKFTTLAQLQKLAARTKTELDAAAAAGIDIPAARGTGYGSIKLGDTTNNVASGAYAVAEGCGTRAEHDGSHVEGFGTFSEFDGEHVFGSYNARTYTNYGHYDPDLPRHIEVVGNGTDDEHRSNARTLDRNGNQWLAGKLTLGAGPTENMDAATKQYVDNGLSNKVTAETGKGLSTNDYTAADKSKVDGLGTAASKGVTTSVDTSTSLPTANAVRSYVESRIEAAVSGALVPGGSVTFANLPAAIAANCNRIYNIEDAFTTTASFKEGAGKSYPAGTNVAIINVGTASSPVYKYDAYTGTYDLSVFLEGSEATDSEVDAMIAEVFGAQP